MQIEAAHAHGIYHVECYDVDGNLKWKDIIHNIVCTAGKNLALDTFFAGNGYVVNGPYVGLISSTGYSAISASDLMSQHFGWFEAGLTFNPTYTGNRPTPVFNTASGGSKSLFSLLSFAITSTGTAKGCFLILGNGASATKDENVGTLYSIGLFAGGDRVVGNGDTITINYTASL